MRWPCGGGVDGEGPAHLATGERGEREALFHLRKMGYTVVAQAMEEREAVGRCRPDRVGWGVGCVLLR